MKQIFYTVIAMFAAIVAVGCEQERQTIIPPGSTMQYEPTKFETQKVDGVWKMLKDGEPFYINGAAANNFYAEIDDWGGNVIRTYSTNADTKALLDMALANGLYVYMGLAMKDSENFDYSSTANAEAIKEQLENHRMWVKRYKNHPAVFCWCIGNEAETGNATSNATYFKYVEEVAQMIHEEDPNHPTTVAFAGADPTNRIKVLIKHAPSIDFLSINQYYNGVAGVSDKIKTASWSKPWVISEYGHRGTWNLSANTDPRQLSWKSASGKVILEEMTSTEKAAIYKSVWKNDIKAKESKGCIGSFIFLWGYQTHGEVLSWYGLFDKDKNSLGAVDEISACWTGKTVDNPAPRIENRKKMKLNGETSAQTHSGSSWVGVTPLAKGSTGNTATVEATSPSGAPLTYRWFIFKEGDAAADGSIPDGIEGLIEDATQPNIIFTAPYAAGAYRLYVYAIDQTNKKVATACIPFLVEDK